MNVYIYECKWKNSIWYNNISNKKKAVKMEYIKTFFFLKPEFSFGTLNISINEFFDPLILNNQYIRFSKFLIISKKMKHSD